MFATSEVCVWFGFQQISSQLERLTSEKKQQATSNAAGFGDGWGGDGWAEFSSSTDEKTEEDRRQNEQLRQELEHLRTVCQAGICVKFCE